MVLVHLQPMVSVIVCHAIAATNGGVDGVLDHGLCLGWMYVSVSVLRGWWSGSHCVCRVHPTVCLVVSTYSAFCGCRTLNVSCYVMLSRNKQTKNLRCGNRKGLLSRNDQTHHKRTVDL